MKDDARRPGDDEADARFGRASPASSPITSVALLLRVLVFTALLPGTVVVVVPVLLLGQRGGRFDVGFLHLAGLLLIMVGAPTLLWCIWDFAHVGRATLAPIDAPRLVVRSGPYRWVRNPMYVANLLILTGEGILSGSWRILGWAAVMALAFHLFVLVYEEPTLARRFGAAYEEYRRTVTRWRPRRP